MNTESKTSVSQSSEEKVGPLRLDEYEVGSDDLCVEYWSPNAEGASKRLIYLEVGPYTVPDFNDPKKSVPLDCAVFLEPTAHGHARKVINGAKRLVSVFESGVVEPGTPVQVTYLGVAQNSKNNNKSARFSVVKLRPRKGVTS